MGEGSDLLRLGKSVLWCSDGFIVVVRERLLNPFRVRIDIIYSSSHCMRGYSH